MLILGLHIGDKLETEFNRQGFINHDSAAVLLRDGKIVAAIEEERLSRVKHCNFFPKRAIDFCLKQEGITLSDIDYVAINSTEYDEFNKSLAESFANKASKIRAGARFVSNNFERLYQQSVADRIVFCSHHNAHVWSVLSVSGFDESLVLILDGDGPSGDGQSLAGRMGKAHGNEFELIRDISGNLSLGNFYTTIIGIIGYDRFDEYKVMGLAPYGDPSRFRSVFKNLYNLKDNGEYELSLNPVLELWPHIHKVVNLIPPRRTEDPFLQVHKDFAATIQETLEILTFHILEYAQRNTNLENLSFAGGVAHNCTLNGKIIESGLFKNIFVQPAAHDAGGAIGAALYAQSIKGSSPPTEKLDHLFYGTPLPRNDEIGKVLSRWQPAINIKKSDSICRETAKLLADGAVVGWVQGRSEFGPRALGNRSILADPRPAENKKRINNMIKKRESYRPFAPSVLEERATDYFNIPTESKSLSFMNLVVTVRESKRTELGAITHVDGSARIQTVSKKTNQLYWSLIDEFRKLTTIPILLNTSFNNNCEPIVDSIDDAVMCFLTTELTHLIVDDYIVYKIAALEKFIITFALAIKCSCRVTTGYKLGAQGFKNTYTIESNASKYFSEESVGISESLFRVLTLGQGLRLKTACEKLNIEFSEALKKEVIKLCENRFISFIPTTKVVN